MSLTYIAFCHAHISYNVAHICHTLNNYDGRCGKRGSSGYHSGNVLSSVPWSVEEEDASILLLGLDGSTGLDLSFSTHIFILDHIKDPALESQIISRANRMGATGSVEVVTIIVNEVSALIRQQYEAHLGQFDDFDEYDV